MIITTSRNIHVRSRKVTHFTLTHGYYGIGLKQASYSVKGFHPSLPDDFFLNLHPWSTEEEARAFISESPYCKDAKEITPREFNDMMRSHRFSWVGKSK